MYLVISYKLGNLALFLMQSQGEEKVIVPTTKKYLHMSPYFVIPFDKLKRAKRVFEYIETENCGLVLAKKTDEQNAEIIKYKLIE